ESRAGCHCATLAHHALALTPPASCRLSFYLYNTPGEVDRAVDAVAAIAAGRGAPGRGIPGPRFRSWPAGRHRTRQRSVGQNGAGQHGPRQQGAHEQVQAVSA
ncbi:MAG TPA: aminotransferase class V-fold PLP-dependent enzyme, partial [Streptosporangiaceae bacterium]